MGYRQDWKSMILRDAPKYGVDPRAAVAVAMMEGLSGAVGDGGHAFGPFQMNDAGGVLTGRPGNHRAYAESRQGIDDALSQMSRDGANGLHGANAVNAIVRRFERPLAPDPEVSGAIRAYGQGVGSVSPVGAVRGSGKGAVSAGGGTPSLGGNGMDPNVRMQLLASLMQGNIPGGGGGSSSVLPLLLAARMGQMTPGAPKAVSGAPVRSGGPLRGPSGPGTAGGKVSFLGATQGERPSFLSALQQAVSAVGGQKVQVTSGYRSPAHNRAVGGAQNSNHMTGDAMDGNVMIPGRGWVPLGIALKGVAGKYGLRSGATFNWNGKPDVVHVDDGRNVR